MKTPEKEIPKTLRRQTARLTQRGRPVDAWPPEFCSIRTAGRGSIPRRAPGGVACDGIYRKGWSGARPLPRLEGIPRSEAWQRHDSTAAAAAQQPALRTGERMAAWMQHLAAELLQSTSAAPQIPSKARRRHRSTDQRCTAMQPLIIAPGEIPTD